MRFPILVVLALSCSATAVGQPNQPTVEAWPKVVLVGDSIRWSYASVVARHLDGTTVVVSSKANGGDSRNVLRNLEHGMIREKSAVVHFNRGSHDTLLPSVARETIYA